MTVISVKYLIISLFVPETIASVSPQCVGMQSNVCCPEYYWNEDAGKCVPCKPGYFGTNCSKSCTPPTYGKGCQQICTTCDNTLCDVSTGCPKPTTEYTSSPLITTFTTNVIITEEATTQPKLSTPLKSTIRNTPLEIISTTDKNGHVTGKPTTVETETKKGFFESYSTLLLGIFCVCSLFVLLFAVFFVVNIYGKISKRRKSKRKVSDSTPDDVFHYQEIRDITRDNCGYNPLSPFADVQEIRTKTSKYSTIDKTSELNTNCQISTEYVDIHKYNDGSCPKLPDRVTENCTQKQFKKDCHDKDGYILPKSSNRNSYVSMKSQKDGITYSVENKEYYADDRIFCRASSRNSYVTVVGSPDKSTMPINRPPDSNVTDDKDAIRPSPKEHEHYFVDDKDVYLTVTSD